MSYKLNMLSDLALDTSKTLDERANKLLQIGLEQLDSELGIISSINNRQYTILYSNNTDIVGEIFDLGMTYCSITLNMLSKKVFSIEHFSKSKHRSHPAYEVFKLETYIGSPIMLNNTPIGTINFTKSLAREKPFCPQDRDMCKHLAVAAALLVRQLN